nr:MAG TPA: hypothetical protein [Caudoviricetes sp.]
MIDFHFQILSDGGEGVTHFAPPALIAAPSIFSPEGYLETQFGIRFWWS